MWFRNEIQKVLQMKEEEYLQQMDNLVRVAKESSTTLTLNLMSQYLSLYHSRGDDESLIKMNFCMMILLIKQGLFDIDRTRTDIKTVLRERELISLMKDFQS